MASVKQDGNLKPVRDFNTRKLVLLALLTAIVVVLQTLATVLPIFPFTLTLVLVPMVIGSALISTLAGGWLGLVFGIVVLATGNANVFLALNPAATIFVVMLKGILAGLASGVAYKLLANKNRTAAVLTAAVVCPVVNTGIFILGSYVFFLPYIMSFADYFGYNNETAIIFLGFVGFNFPMELCINIILSPVIVRLIQYGSDRGGQRSA